MLVVLVGLIHETRGMTAANVTHDREARDRELVKTLRRSIKKLRKFPDNTDPSTRHLQMIAEGLLGGGYTMLTEEPEHCAVTMLSVCLSLYKAREALHKVTGQYFPDHPA